MPEEAMKLKEIIKTIEKLFPLALAQDWDNVGLLIGDENRQIEKILLTIDITKEVLAEAKRLKTDLILSYHPVIWDGLKKITSDDIVYKLIRSGIAVFSIHTVLDAVAGGVNDGLAEMVGIVDGEPIGDYVAYPTGDNYKLVVFVPVKAAERVSNAVFAAVQCNRKLQSLRLLRSGSREFLAVRRRKAGHRQKRKAGKTR